MAILIYSSINELSKYFLSQNNSCIQFFFLHNIFTVRQICQTRYLFFHELLFSMEHHKGVGITALPHSELFVSEVGLKHRALTIVPL